MLCLQQRPSALSLSAEDDEESSETDLFRLMRVLAKRPRGEELPLLSFAGLLAYTCIVCMSCGSTPL